MYYTGIYAFLEIFTKTYRSLQQTTQVTTKYGLRNHILGPYFVFRYYLLE